jgi:hypothetical protein
VPKLKRLSHPDGSRSVIVRRVPARDGGKLD